MVAGAVTRLQDMGVESYLISSSLLAIQAQRLVRRVCADCGEQQSLTEDEATVLQISSADCPTINRGKGCEACGNTGMRTASRSDSALSWPWRILPALSNAWYLKCTVVIGRALPSLLPRGWSGRP